MHKNSKLYRQKVAALKKARAARAVKLRAIKVAFVRKSEVSPAALARDAAFDAVRWSDIPAPPTTLESMIREAVRAKVRELGPAFVKAELDALLA